MTATPDPGLPTEPPRATRWGAELAFAIDLADRAGALLVDLQDRLVSIEHKSETDVVTEADHLSEALVIDAVREAFPADAVFSEEVGTVLPAAEVAPSGRTWVMDPLDGTVNYANGIPFFCFSLALVVDGRPVAGVVRDPVRGESYAATEDGPAMLDGRVISPRPKERLRDCVISMGLSGERSAERWARLRGAVRVPRGFGSAALALAYTANGRFDAFIQEQNLSPWDIAAAGLIAERAGVTVSDLAGGPWFVLDAPTRSMSVVAAAAPHHATLLELLRR
ncbi:MAG: inositol monophosphatase [Chloroflexi bacterium]|nr:inositol monophosphatase [Chloroflexota bacterium]